MYQDILHGPPINLFPVNQVSQNNIIQRLTPDKMTHNNNLITISTTEIDLGSNWNYLTIMSYKFLRICALLQQQGKIELIKYFGLGFDMELGLLN